MSQRTDDPQAIVVLAAVLIGTDGRVLVLRRAASEPLAGYWEFPGGKREDGEDDRRCLERELDEELGLRVRAGEEIARHTHHYPERTVHIHLRHCLPLDAAGRPIPADASLPLALRVHDAAQWLPVERLDTIELLPADIALLPPLAAFVARRRAADPDASAERSEP